MINEKEEKFDIEVNHPKENVESVGQMIIGGLEQLGGILTGDPLTRAEGEFNSEVGSIHQESNKNLTAIDRKEENSGEESK